MYYLGLFFNQSVFACIVFAIMMNVESQIIGSGLGIIPGLLIVVAVHRLVNRLPAAVHLFLQPPPAEPFYIFNCDRRISYALFNGELCRC